MRRADRWAIGPLRAITRLLTLLCWLAGGTVFLMVLGVVARRNIRMQPRLVHVLRVLARGTLGILHVQVDCIGTLPNAPVLIAANHLSWLDILVLFAHWNVTFVAKREVASWPFIGPLCSVVGVVTISREKKMDIRRSLPMLMDRLQSGQSVVLFAEGTTTDGRRVLPFQSALFEAARRTGCDVVPLTLSAAVPVGAPCASRSVCWCGEEALLTHIPRVAALPWARITSRVGRPIAPSAHRKLLARQVHAQVAAHLVPIPQLTKSAAPASAVFEVPSTPVKTSSTMPATV